MSGVYGVRGWVKIFSYTEPRQNIIHYKPWYLKKDRDADWVPVQLAEGREHGKGVVARLQNCEDRDQAYDLMGSEIAIRRDQLPATGPGEYYWAELQGLRVVTVEGEALGIVDHLLSTGANDVLVVKGERERLIPFLMGSVIIEVDLERGEIKIDWDKDF
ncbi:MAG: ribosome maturation factor RimM [Thiogranum sp.]|nr:ribosome maturation factor RimM [Thiogranum sp.]